MSGIFISYRRDDAQGWAGRLADSLRAELGRVNVFRDIDDIPLGADFELYIRERVKSCQVLLVLIGPRWLGAQNAQGQRRIDAPDDFVRLEIATAQQQRLLVIPMLVGGAEMPAEAALPDDLKFITRRQAYRLSDERWNEDIAKLAVTLRAALDPQRAARRNKLLLAGAGAVVAGSVIAFNLNTGGSHRDDPAPPAPVVAGARPAPPEAATPPPRAASPPPAQVSRTPKEPNTSAASRQEKKTVATKPAVGAESAVEAKPAADGAGVGAGSSDVDSATAPQAEPASTVSWVYLGTSEGSELESTTFNAATVPQPGDAIVAATEVPKRADDSVRADDCIIGKVIGALPSHSEVTVRQLRKMESVTPGQYCVWAKVTETGAANAALR